MPSLLLNGLHTVRARHVLVSVRYPDHTIDLNSLSKCSFETEKPLIMKRGPVITEMGRQEGETGKHKGSTNDY